MIQALVLSKLDYCNSLLIGSPEFKVDKPQCIQNMSCRIMCNIKKHDHITTHMASPHWLKVHDRITYKITMIVFKCHQGTAPQYVMDLIPQKHTLRQLRSSTSEDLVPAFFMSSHGYKSAFSAVRPRMLYPQP